MIAETIALLGLLAKGIILFLAFVIMAVLALSPNPPRNEKE